MSPAATPSAKKFILQGINQAFGHDQSRADCGEDDHIPMLTSTKTVEVTLSTHDASGVTELDVKLAKR